MYNYGLTTTGYSAPTASGSVWSLVWLIVSLVAAVVGGIVLYFTVFADKKEGKYKGFMAWLYNFVKFKKLYITVILKVTYMVGAIFLTLYSFALIGTSFLAFLGTLLLGNLFLRLVYEGALVILSIHENVVDINSKMKK